ncbi:methyl-accepting chemotaxis protein [Paraburkholderia sp. 2C]|jgi:methyl-accepting chemotaxis protein
MKTMTGWTVRGRLVAGFGSVLVAVIALAAIAIYQVENVRMRLDDIIDVNGVKERYAINFRGSVHDRSIAVRDVTLVPPEELPKVVDHINSLEADYEHSAQPFSQIFEQAADVTPEERQIYGRITAARERTIPLISRIIELQKSGDTDGARKLLLAEARPAFVDWLAAINTMIDYEESLSQDEGERAREISKQFRLLMATLTALACLFSAGVAWLVVRNITRSLGADPRDMIAFAESIEAGDLSRRAPVRAGDTSSVMATVTRMRNNLADIVQQVRQAAHGVADASREIAQGNGDLDERTHGQAAALEQATNALGKFDASVQSNADNAVHADELAKRASVTASEGGDAVGRVVDTMHGINTSSNRIGEIISVIDSIAFQTNILALNAAVEAARAGAQGRGFAVVAGEVRVLAQRSAEAAREVKALVQESSARVGEGTRLVDDAGSTIAEVVSSSGSVTTIMSEINDACRQQTQQISEVRAMIDQLENGTRQNVALVQQSGAAADALLAQAEHLLTAVGVFKLDGSAREGHRDDAGSSFNTASPVVPMLSAAAA